MMKSEKIESVLQAARKEIEKEGWEITETFGNNDQLHLVLMRDNKRKAWGMFDRVTCWSEAYRAIFRKDILTLV